ncbi:MAG: dTMP kinase [Candidatus Muproteobacteria bacterium RBG_19FT_COMBO_61_10]|uniref:Thymidylate kinase n=1 Tax=Candidatus Muproteobacteria bacterium RBG_19FT_COMBO_61_10 TaxID=1817761 RepID=A0A1F6UGP4_9PROT|nr:MAG: dTMP kinase [Candidatus Muproteobacteria bacterium RBG_19FT_COMBO_61_10]
MNRGKFITLEGSEGAGKSTSLAYIQSYLAGQGVAVIGTREPGGTDIGEQLRNILLQGRGQGMASDTELLLMFAARAEHLDKLIRPALAAGQWVLCDRFTDATYAYQGGGRGIADARIRVLENWTQGDLRPDVTLLFDIPTAQGLQRAGRRSTPDRFEQEDQDFFERVRQRYLARAAEEPGRIHLINAAVDIAGVQAQLRDVLARVLA